MMLKFKAWDKDKKVMSIIDEIDFNSGYILISTGYKSFNEVKLLQYTGFKDVHGVEIYEGDIVRHSEKPNPCFCYPFKVIQARTGEWRLDNFRCGTVLAFSNQDELEVIGNIYENSELLEDE
ncbi:YopX family protein [Staphylococcus aureus]|uniref:YopX family protein n=4 Tax=Staphylococcus aureus TaxID=1280 RepID=UPI002073CFD1|nr:YopX family protein [Staphylococcus aureus]MCM6948416.1 YopX family protein [Staphylococcus aureus]